MKIVAVIPARYASSRFLGKPLVDICGYPMIYWVYKNAKKVDLFSDVYVATEDDRIFKKCEELGIKCIMTSSSHPTGTDRIGEVAQKIKADLYVNIQGDEPLLEPEVIKQAILPFFEDESLQITNLMTEISDPVDVVNFTVPKVLTNKDNIAIYLTRATAPYPKGSIDYHYYKQVCVYGFKPEALEFFSSYGKQFGKAKLEKIEDIELLRFIENGYKVKFVNVNTKSVAVDTEKDLEKVRRIFSEIV